MDRRKFAGAVAASAAGLALAKASRAAATHDLALTNVSALIDGAWKLCDLGVNAGKIAAIAPAGTLTGAETIKGDGLHVSPGWVDIHVHCVDLRHGRAAGSAVSRLGVAHGVTAIADAGTTGVTNYAQLERAAADYPETQVHAWLNIVSQGIRLQDYLRAEPGWENIGQMERTAADHKRIIGIKYRADSTVTPKHDRLYYVRKCREAGDALKLPVMIHIGSAPPDLKDILPHLKPGDMITHSFRKSTHCVLDAAGRLREEVRQAADRGLRFDIGHGVGSFSFDTAERALAQGLTDISISSDLYILSTPKYARTFANVLTSFLMLGMPLEQIMYKCSVKPAENIGVQRGIAEGADANLTVFKVVDGDFSCVDTTGQKRKAAKRIFPEWSVVAGKVTKAGELDRKLFL